MYGGNFKSIFVYVYCAYCLYDCIGELASFPGSSQFFNAQRATLKSWEEPGDEAIGEQHH